MTQGGASGGCRHESRAGFEMSQRKLSLLERLYWIGKGVGWDNVPRRVYQALAVRCGIVQRKTNPANYRKISWRKGYPNKSSADRWQDRRVHFFPLLQQAELQSLVSEELWQRTVGVICEEALQGHYPFFSRWTGNLGWPPNFNRDPVHEIDWPVGEHWTRSTRSGPPRDDIKLVWEASRFTLAYHLVRHYTYTGDERWAEAFWQLYESWRDQNPVNLTVAWGCGQEVAFRVMAVLFGVMATLNSPSSTEQRLEDVELFVWQSAKRIAANINYAISQENNHALSEAAALWTVGLLFPEFADGKKWRKSGERVLEGEVRRQIYADGSYVQHSFSYHRVMLDDLSWVIQLGRLNRHSFSGELLDRFAAATKWLGQVIDGAAGRVPNYGANDGANVLPLSVCDYLDYRPTCQLAETLAGSGSTLSRGLWSEKAAWLLGEIPQASIIAAQAPTWAAPIGGYYLLRGPASRAFVRAAEFRDRPGQCDQLHLDLWYRGHNLLRDAGSYLYYHKDPNVKKYFYSTGAHNTVSVPGAEQMTKGPKFLWFHWSKAKANFNDPTKLTCRARFRGGKPYQHERVIERNGDCYVVRDRVKGVANVELHWRLSPDWTWTLGREGIVIGRFGEMAIEIEIVADGQPVKAELRESFESLYYGERQLSPAIWIQGVSESVVTRIAPSG